MKTSQIRSSFLSYFNKNGHAIIQSSSLVPQNDQTLLFTNAGMVQFKDVFIGLDNRPYKRATTSQKCVRAGGKHNDLDQVGFTARHHTFFEMLGNFSFGDYFKAEAIEFAWNFITKELGVDKSRLLSTVYHTDEEAIKIWKKVAGNDFRIIPISTSDNFWAMGDTGPCGPCSEIFFDHGAHISGGMPGTKDQDGDRFVEIWNIVFMQFEQLISGEKVPLKAQSIDTGMGLERIAAVMQGVHDNYETDIFKSIISNIQNLSGISANEKNISSYKVISDHLRSMCFLITDGVFPSNEGRGYVLRRIIRRAIRHSNLLGIKDSFINKLVPHFLGLMKDVYSELEIMKDTITSIVEQEESKFISTLDRGLSILNSEIEKISGNKVLDGKIAFKLYDTYGFPLDLTQDILKTNGITVDTAGFTEAMQEQKNRAAWSNSTYDKDEDAVYFNIKNEIQCQKFNGYDLLETNAKIESIVMHGKRVDKITSGEKGSIITDITTCYAECGGQVGDIGIISKSLGAFNIENTRKVGELIIHEGVVESGSFSVKENVKISVCESTRKNTARHHTVTHLLQSALRKILGAHVAQKGSFVCSQYMRFDFSHHSAISHDQMHDIENLVNEWVMANLEVKKSIMSKEEALKSGSMALFGEKYEDNVRVISIGDISSELCGGTHVEHTGEIGFFKIKSESSIGSGLRRIEGIAGSAFFQYMEATREKLDRVNSELKCSDSDTLLKLNSLIENKKNLEQEIATLKQKIAISSSNEPEKINGVNLQICKIHDLSMKELRHLIDNMKHKIKSGVVIVFGVESDKVSVLISASDDINLSAKDLLMISLKPLNGNGGGKKDLAQGGGTDPSKIDESLSLVKEYIRSLIYPF